MGSTLQATPLDLGIRETAEVHGVPQLRQIQSVHELFVRALAGSLSSYLQTEIQVSVEGIKAISAGDFLAKLKAPACVIRLQLHPRPESMILHLDSAAVFNVLELLLGGKGLPAKAETRELTEIEWSLLEEVVRVVVADLGEAWRPFHEVEFRVESLENDPSMLATGDLSVAQVQVAVTLGFGSGQGRLQFAVPQSFFETAAQAPHQESRAIPAPEEDIQRNLELIGEAVVDVDVLLEGSTMRFGELAELRPGQVLTFDYSLVRPLKAVINGAIAITGHVVSTGRKRAFQIEGLP